MQVVLAGCLISYTGTLLGAALENFPLENQKKVFLVHSCVHFLF
jgi:hypothetical protein